MALIATVHQRLGSIHRRNRALVRIVTPGASQVFARVRRGLAKIAAVSASDGDGEISRVLRVLEQTAAEPGVRTVQESLTSFVINKWLVHPLICGITDAGRIGRTG